MRQRADGNRLGAHLRGQQGGIVTGWLVQMVIFMAILGLVGYEIVSVVITTVNLDQLARDVAVAGATNYDDTRDEEEAFDAAAAEAERQGAELRTLTVDGTQIAVEIFQQAPTVLIHKIGPLEGFTKPSAKGRSRWQK